jgi:hypothetical protein
MRSASVRTRSIHERIGTTQRRGAAGRTGLSAAPRFRVRSGCDYGVGVKLTTSQPNSSSAVFAE